MHWMIGDIHGMLAPLEALLPEIHKRDPGARQKVIEWITALRREEARKNAGDPGTETSWAKRASAPSRPLSGKRS